MEKHEQVFVSSTYLDLVEERQSVMQALLMADCSPSGMELFPASNDERWELIRKIIDQSDYYIVIVGGRYGSTDDEGISYTEREYDYATEIELPILGFLHGDPGEIPSKNVDMDEQARQKLNAFREKVGGRMCKFFNGSEDLAGKVALSLMAARKQHSAVGWVRGDEALTEETRSELLTLRAKVAELELEHARVASNLSDRAGLEHGDDVVTLGFGATLSMKPPPRSLYSMPVLLDPESRGVSGEVAVMWNDVLEAVGPLLLEEDSESKVFASVDSLALNR